MSNLSRLQELLAQNDIPALAVTAIHNVRWASGFSGSAGTVLATPDKAAFFTDGRYALQAAEQVQDLPSFTTSNDKPIHAWIKEICADWGVSRLGFEGDHVTYNTYKSWAEKLEGIELFGCPDLIGKLRMVKTEQEIECIRRAVALTDACFNNVLPRVQAGVTDLEIALEIEFFIKRNGAKLAFEPIVVSGHRSAMPHGTPSEKVVEIGDFVTMDFGAQVDGYCADLTRTVVIGEASSRHEEVYQAVLEAQMAAIGACKPGVDARDIDKAARDSLASKGLDKHFTHGLGHGLGGVVHDNGRLNSISDDVLEAGQVWTVEPGVYIEGWGGCRIEDDIVITESGYEVLNKATKQMLVLSPYGK